MANRIPKLTKRAVEALKANGADTVYWDGELTGFGVRVRKSGSVTEGNSIVGMPVNSCQRKKLH